MEYITTTNLRNKSSLLVSRLSKGQTVSLVHRSKIIGEIKPKKEAKALTEADIKQLKKLASELSFPKISYKERERRYRKHLMEKYGQSLS
ncbi:hypothetical protein A2W45_04115 [Candidatus Curtissbacteria bacterium RIFCSPHIGHO2_12_41_11]|uniref:Antitoxin n=2 Tax=Candidatus Curtissiibacteriota TaxID=1752717 RepID=A0A1F5H5S7_9BACT|nr:MAG: hypothetical protein A3D07_03930 [Candidatus Curtissbacteria bacterium RIFCSPHIGHO2_02_FULL_42_15]OGD99429.1 MAG: hypothetical protein A2W45_04115 [Candidatus Curtissbacteria bacterium RIFCSPHIGHO2_12_41_11]